MDGELAARVLGARRRLAEAAPRLSLQELLVAMLDEAGGLSGSPIGFCHFLEADQVTIEYRAWSRRTTDGFGRAEGKGTHHPVSQAGPWADCIRLRHTVVHNDYASLPRYGNSPPGRGDPVREMVVPVLRDGRIVAVVGVGNKATAYEAQDVEDLTALADLMWDLASGKVLEERLRHGDARLRAVLDCVDPGVGLWSPEGRLTHANPPLRRLLDLDSRDDPAALHAAGLGLTSEDGSPLDLRSFPPSRALRTGRSESATLRFLDAQGDEHFVLASAHPLRDPSDGTLLGAAATLSDVTERKRRQDSLEAAGRHDPVTGLPNRVLLMDRLEQAMASARRSGAILAVCLFDLDGFKGVNERIGRTGGDDVLREVGRRLRSTLRGGDTVARTGGDEFVVLLSGARQRPEIDRALERIVSVALERVPVPGHPSIRLSASIGVAAFPDDAVDPVLLLQRADDAMHAAKQLGRDRWAWC